MNFDEMMLFIKRNPDCGIVDLMNQFSISATRAVADANRMVRTGWLIRNHIRSKVNNKLVIGYRVHPDWNTVLDNADGSMKEPHVVKLLRIQYKFGSRDLALGMLNAHNVWRKANGKELIQMAEFNHE